MGWQQCPALSLGEGEKMVHISKMTLEITDWLGGELSPKSIEKVLTAIPKFSPGFKRCLVELIGNNPLAHSDFFGVLGILKKYGCDVIVTANGTPLLNSLQNNHLKELSKFSFSAFIIKLDNISVVRELIQVMDTYPSSVSRLIKMLVFGKEEKEINDKMEEMILIAREQRWCDGIVFSGELLSFTNLAGKMIVTKEYFKNLLEKIYTLQQKYNSQHFFVGTAEPLIRLLNSSGGFSCSAGVNALHETVTGTVTPCRFLPQVPLNLENYIDNEFIKAVLDRNLKGKCAGTCANASYCIGCRARAFAASGDWRGEDPYCWL